MATASNNTDPVRDDPAQSLIDPPEGAAVAVSYLRVSTKEQAERGGRDEGFSIPAQREANRRKAGQLGAAVVEEFVDAGESARKADRPELMRMIRYVKQHKVAYCIVHKVDRLARNRADDVTIHLALQQAGVLLVSATENIDETPSGMLLHGIMSTIAEFYSRNLATEVTKGMTQKAAGGGTLGKAPIGYLNVRTRDELGREARTVELDPERAPLVQWAFKAYASGNWTVSQLHDELTSRGLMSLPTPKRPSKPMAVSSVHRLLTNPYYKGDVTYRGVNYKGAHQPLVPAEVWYQVQSVLTAHKSAAEATQIHDHYLKGTIHCGGCGSRLIVSNAKNRHGNVYCYFVCSGRHSKRTNCDRSAILIADVEKLIEDYYQRIQITPAQHEALAGMLHHEFDRLMSAEVDELAQLTANRDRLQHEQERLLQAHYADAIPLALLKREQDRILGELDQVSRRIDAHHGEYADARAHLDDALNLLTNCADIYNRCDDANRRLCNQAFFTKVYIDEDDELRVENNRPFEMLLDPEINANALTWAENADKTRTTTNDSVGKGSSLVRRVEPRGLEPLTPTLPIQPPKDCGYFD
ncbi:recombinase family protein [Gordonia hongkongensis]|uniref:recombinase family protein n=1 Tax=Gordonia hongkongensis TaxID=1701090 RepID=UPI0030CEC3ED